VSNNKIDVFILAAGEANRMFPLSTIMEKSLLPIDGKPVIRHIVDNLKVCEYVGEITICCLDKFKKQFEHEFRDCMEFVDIIGFEEPIGTYKTFFAMASIKIDTSEYVMVHYADCLTKIDYDDFIVSCWHSEMDGIIAVTNTVKHDYSEVVLENPRHTITRVKFFNEKPRISNYSWSGIGLFNKKKILQYYPNTENTDFAQDIFPRLVNRKALKAYPYNGYWYDCGNLNSYRKLCNLYNNGEKS
jgi:NDP-sugar pyrophosphorylase family protein